MTTNSNIQRQIAITISTILVWADSLCNDQILWFSHYNNEPKQGGSWSGFNVN